MYFQCRGGADGSTLKTSSLNGGGDALCSACSPVAPEVSAVSGTGEAADGAACGSARYQKKYPLASATATSASTARAQRARFDQRVHADFARVRRVLTKLFARASRVRLRGGAS